MIWLRLLLALVCIVVLVEVVAWGMCAAAWWYRRRQLRRILDRGHRMMLAHEQALSQRVETLCLTNGRDPLHSADPLTPL